MGQSMDVESEMVAVATGEFVGGRVEPLPDPEAVTTDETSDYPLPEGTVAIEPDEDESVSLDDGIESAHDEDVVYTLSVAAATHGREFDGPLLAELLESGGIIEDVRLMIAIAVLRTGQKLNGDRMLRVLEGMGFAGEAMAGRLARDELAKVEGGIVIESSAPVPGVETVVVAS